MQHCNLCSVNRPTQKLDFKTTGKTNFFSRTSNKYTDRFLNIVFLFILKISAKGMESTPTKS